MDVGEEDEFGAAAVGAGCAGDGSELLELASLKPVKVGGHPLWVNGPPACLQEKMKEMDQG